MLKYAQRLIAHRRLFYNYNNKKGKGDECHTKTNLISIGQSIGIKIILIIRFQKKTRTFKIFYFTRAISSNKKHEG